MSTACRAIFTVLGCLAIALGIIGPYVNFVLIFFGAALLALADLAKPEAEELRQPGRTGVPD